MLMIESEINVQKVDGRINKVGMQGRISTKVIDLGH